MCHFSIIAVSFFSIFRVIRWHHSTIRLVMICTFQARWKICPMTNRVIIIKRENSNTEKSLCKGLWWIATYLLSIDLDKQTSRKYMPLSRTGKHVTTSDLLARWSIIFSQIDRCTDYFSTTTSISNTPLGRERSLIIIITIYYLIILY